MNGSASSTAPTAIRARWILPVDAPPIRDGLVVASHGRIVFVGPAPAGDVASAWQECAVLPAPINAHTHLEFSSLTQPLGQPNMPFTDWIRRVISWRREREQDPVSAAAQRRTAVQAGWREVRRGGTAAVGEIATSATSAEELTAAELASIVFVELIGLSRERIAPVLSHARNMLPSSASSQAIVRWGISPHAPYTVHPELLAESVRWSAQRRIPLAMHLAETTDELQLLREGTGPFQTLLTELNAWDPTAIPSGSRPLDYLRVLAQAHQALVIHGNYLNAEERLLVATQRDRLTVVYCPRTHAYFGHDPYPLQAFLDCGARVALGTDSRASNPDLDMLAEMRFAAARHPDVRPEAILRMATLHSAEALGLSRELGSLCAGKRAQFVTVPLTPEGASDPYSWLH